MKTQAKLVVTAFLFGVLIVALLIATVVLTAIVLSNQNKEKKESSAPAFSTVSTPLSPVNRKDIVVLVDASRDVDQVLLEQEANFIQDALVPSLSGKGPESYKMMLAVVTFASSTSLEELEFVDMANNDGLKALVDAIRASKSNVTLNIGAALKSLHAATLRIRAFDGTSLMIMASSQGENFADAVSEANILKAKGTQVMTISLNDTADSLSELAFDAASAFDGRSIATADISDMKMLAESMANAIIFPAEPTAQETSSIITTSSTTTTGTVATTATTVATTTTSSSSTSTTTATHITTTESPGARKLIILVDASSNLTQEDMKKQSTFISDTLLPTFKTPSESDGYPTQVQIIPFAFDTSAEIEDYVTLTAEDEVALQKQIVVSKLAKITTFSTPLDDLHIGQAFTQIHDIDAKKIPTHVLIFASGQGSDYENAKKIASPLIEKYNITLIPVSLVGPESSFTEISSPGCAVNGNGILGRQGLDDIASNIAKCIYPSYVPPEKPSDVVILIDASSSAASVATVAKQSDFVKNNLLPVLKQSLPNITYSRIVMVPYAFYLSADAQEFLYFTATSDDFDKQLHRARVASITAFSSPLDRLQIAPTLQLLIESGLIESANAKILLMASSPGVNISDAASFAKNITDSTKSLLVVALGGDVGSFTAMTGAENIINGTAVSGNDDQAKNELAQVIAQKWPANSKELFSGVHTVSIQKSRVSLEAIADY